MTTQHVLPNDWTKSSRSNATQPDCVEIAGVGHPVTGRVRDSKNPSGGAITVSRGTLTAFLEAVKSE